MSSSSQAHAGTSTEQIGVGALAWRLGVRVARGAGGLGWSLLTRQTPRALAFARATAVNAAPVRVRLSGADVATDPDSLARAYPDATGWLLVLLPEPGQAESVWDGEAASYAEPLRRLLDWTPVQIRVPGGGDDQGAGVGVELSALLQVLHDHWPVPITRIAVVASGEGGLALRSAAAVATVHPRSWQSLTGDVVLLGTPHLVVPPTPGSSAIGRGLEAELAGVIGEDRARPGLPELDARYAVITRRARQEANPIGALLGSLVWWRDRSRRRPRQARELFPSAELHCVDDAGQPLAAHSEVRDALMRWLA
ncbi:hypothetical protein NODU109028_14645 [Nocardioides dubius]|uniref:Alpha/beta hydrolase n=1 Tax=Nocardioides dubius TaxID=317019 RepID=A0ABN1U0C3_9ACTN